MWTGFLLLSALACVPLSFPQDDIVFHSGVSLVRVDAEITDSNGSVIAGLNKDDFRVFDQEQPQELVSVSFEREPLDLILLFDAAGSMRGKLLQVIRAVELGFHELRAGDRVCVMAFRSDVTEIAPFNADLEQVNQAIAIGVPAARFGGASDPERAAQAAAVRLRLEPASQRRRAVLIVSDRIPSRSAKSNEALQSLWNSDAVLSVLEIGHDSRMRFAEPGASELVDKTGGAIVIAGDPGDAFRESLRRIRSRYTLYYPLPQGTPRAEHSVRVELSGDAAGRFPHAHIRARSGYFAPPSRAEVK